MGYEIKRVPSDWVHPKRERNGRLSYQPMHIDRSYRRECEDWYANAAKFVPHDGYKFFHEEHDGPPDSTYYPNRDWTPEEATHIQMYETVSEGTPVTPVFATKEELVEYLVHNGTFWDQERGDGGWSLEAAEGFAIHEWSCSGLMIPGKGYFTGRDKEMYESMKPLPSDIEEVE